MTQPYAGTPTRQQEMADILRKLAETKQKPRPATPGDDEDEEEQVTGG